jgi:hypothetical protein
LMWHDVGETPKKAADAMAIPVAIVPAIMWRTFIAIRERL